MVRVAYAAGGANYHTWLPIAVSADALEIGNVIQGALEVFWFTFIFTILINTTDPSSYSSNLKPVGDMKTIRATCCRTTHWLLRNCRSTPITSGFQPHHSSQTAVLHEVSDILAAGDSWDQCCHQDFFSRPGARPCRSRPRPRLFLQDQEFLFDNR